MKSMTGYGRAQEIVSNDASRYEITAEMRSVNHRYFEFSPRVPRVYGFLEDTLKHLVHQSLSRGKVDLFVSINPTHEAHTQVVVNTGLAKSYLENLQSLGKTLDLTDDVTLSTLARFGDIFQVERQEEDQEFITQAVSQVVAKALQELVAMRKVEGEKTKADILQRVSTVEHHLDTIETLAPQTAKEYHDRLYQRLTEVLEDHQIEEQRLVTEAALFADRVAVDEETVRLRSHLAQVKTVVEEPEPVGRKLDFIVQELNREINTIGSKSQNVEINHRVVEMKSEIEKIREQVQNIE